MHHTGELFGFKKPLKKEVKKGLLRCVIVSPLRSHRRAVATVRRANCRSPFCATAIALGDTQSGDCGATKNSQHDFCWAIGTYRLSY